jgi:hypothetical protein
MIVKAIKVLENCLGVKYFLKFFFLYFLVFRTTENNSKQNHFQFNWKSLFNFLKKIYAF